MEDFPFFLLLLSPSLPSICESADRSYFRVLVFTGHFAFTGHYGPFAKRVWFTARGGGETVHSPFHLDQGGFDTCWCLFSLLSVSLSICSLLSCGSLCKELPCGVHAALTIQSNTVTIGPRSRLAQTQEVSFSLCCIKVTQLL